MSKTEQVKDTRNLKLGFGTLIVIFVIFGVFVLYDIQRVADLNLTIYHHPLVVSNAALQANVSIAKMHRSMKDVVLFKSSSRIRESIEAVNEEEKQVYRHLNAVKENILGEKGKTLEKEARHLFDEWRPIRSEVIGLVKNKKREIAANITIGKGAYHVNVLEEKMIGLTNYARARAAEFTEDTQRVHSRLKVTSIFFLIVGILSSFLVAFLTLKRNYLVSKKLLESEEKFRALFEQAGGYCMILDPNTSDGIPVIIDANEAACVMHGYTREEFIGRPVTDIDDEDGKRLVTKRTAEIMTGKPFYVENEHVRKNGTSFYVAVNANRIDLGSKPPFILTSEYDITERKRAEQQLKESQEQLEIAMDAAEDGLYDWNLLTNQIYYSPGWKRMLGYEDDELPNDFSIWEKLTRPDDVKKSWGMQQELVEKKRDRFEIEFKMKHKSGHWVDILSRAKAIFDDSDKAVRIIGTHIDVTERKRLEASLLQSQKMESIGNLAGGIAHDFNNILSSVLGFSELALDEVEKGSAMEDNLQEIYAGGLRAKEIVNQILAFARQSDEEKKPTRVDVIIIETLKLIRPSTPSTIAIRKEIESSSLVIGNSTQVHQIIMNLCTNAAHAMQDNGGIMEVTLKDVHFGENINIPGGLEKGNYIELAISDTGCGIEPEHIDSIFDPYFTTKETGKGTGMGLAMVRGIVESYGGTILVESTPSVKTIISIYLPITSNLDDEIIFETETLPKGDEHILFVDDEPPIARMGGIILKSLGYQVTTRTSSIEAFELFKAKPDDFQLVITDMTMPHMTGDKFSFELKQIRADIPIILCTGYSNKINAETAQEIGINAFMDKPFSQADLASTVREVLDKA